MKPVLHFAEQVLAASLYIWFPIARLVQKQTSRSAKGWRSHLVRNPQQSLWISDRRTQLQNFFCEANQPLELRAATRKNNSTGQYVFSAGFQKFMINQFEHLAHARFDDECHVPARNLARGALADRRHIDHFHRVNVGSARSAAALFEYFCRIDRSFEPDRKILRHVLSAEADRRRIFNAAVDIDNEIDDTRADVADGNSEVFFRFG